MREPSESDGALVRVAAALASRRGDAPTDAPLTVDRSRPYTQTRRVEREWGAHDDGRVDAVNRVEAAPALDLHSLATDHAAGRAERILALQRAAGNRATGRVLQRAPTLLGELSKFMTGRYLAHVNGEQIWVTSEAEEAEAAQLIADIQADYGVEISSLKGVAATRFSRSGDTSEEDLATITTRPWLLIELRAIERALSHFAPILGSRRLLSTRGGTQELLSVGKVDAPLAHYRSVYGAYFKEDALRSFAMYEFGEKKIDGAYRTLERTMEGTAVHEIAHGLFRYAIPEFMDATGYWLTEDSWSRAAGAEAPPTDYGDTNAREDLSETVTLYFIDPDRLRNGRPGAAAGEPGNPCPIRFAVIESLVSRWASTPAAE